ncbi:fatty acid cis/trans isomerase [Paraglaciecola arctica]|uniref:Fatty acid cis/trans isomerase n=1 Tax=Paraglaciecola arctica BSs20135 TaxID=493475 RepID=K6YBL7_9ALTE|nr:fatty acid cis/trans isomerase [Paraglaciecola arctica]GAC21311.1 fatty acid cis/trans isomerase [Paraglaciecola arctica BSs20135]
MKLRLIFITIIVLLTLVISITVSLAPSKQVISLSDISLDPSLSQLDYSEDIRPILEHRCVVCHACYDAPCQLKLGSSEGITRGANKERVYDGKRLVQANLTRLFEDGHTTNEWRDKDFFAVVADKATSPEENVNASVLAKILLQKQHFPLPNQTLLPETLELDLKRDSQCPSNDEFDAYQADFPLWGMPYGLPKLSSTEQQKLLNWVAYGGKVETPTLLNEVTKDTIDDWETFFNQDSKKAQLMSRYLFEHLFLVNLYFDDTQPGQFFRMVRSSTKPGEEIKGIFTRRPFDDPKVNRVYYRLQAVTQSIAHKSHMPVKLDKQRKKRWLQWFIEADYDVDVLPTYQPKEASNPFITFAQIPVKSRYRYMLDESQNTIMQFIKGPVCRGQLALNVINDHFWVLFADPDLTIVENSNQFMQQARQKIVLPAEAQSNALPTSWMAYAAMEKEYLKTKSAFIDEHIKDKVKLDLDLLWDGDGNNDNLALTVFRHDDASTVVKGLIGDTPQTAWILTYPLFERIHYLLVAGYDVYGNVGHQLNSRMYMDFLRMEGEFNFLNLLPISTRKKVRNKWYRGSVSEVEKFVYDANQASLETDVKYESSDHLSELYTKIRQRVANVSSQKYALENGNPDNTVIEALKRINRMAGSGVSQLPNSSIVRIVDKDSQQSYFYTLLRHNAHSNISHLFGEQNRRLPEEDTVSIAPNLMTSHPNAFFSVSSEQIDEFATQLTNLASEQDYRKFKDTFGVRRTSENFWSYADMMHAYFRRSEQAEYGVLDFNRLENK